MESKNKLKNIKINSILWAVGIFFISILIIQLIYIFSISEDGRFWSYLVKTFFSSDFILSFLASAYEDILFFMIIGIVLFKMSVKNPEEDMLENRINNLFTNNDKVDSFVLNKSRESLKKLAVYSDKTDVIIDILDVKEYKGNTLLKVGFEKEYSLKSLIHDLDNLETEGKLEFYGETGAKLPKDQFGMITVITLRYNKNEDIKISQNDPLVKEKQVVSFIEKFNKDDNIILYANFWMWMLNEDVISHTAYRNTSNTNISVNNKLREDIIVTLADKGDIPLSKDSSCEIIENKEMESLQDITFKVAIKNKRTK